MVRLIGVDPGWLDGGYVSDAEYESVKAPTIM